MSTDPFNHVNILSITREAVRKDRKKRHKRFEPLKPLKPLKRSKWFRILLVALILNKFQGNIRNSTIYIHYPRKVCCRFTYVMSGIQYLLNRISVYTISRIYNESNEDTFFIKLSNFNYFVMWDLGRLKGENKILVAFYYL